MFLRHCFLQHLMVIIFLFPMASFAKVNVINAGDDCEILLGRIQNASMEERLARWTEFEAKYQLIYDKIIFGREKSGWQERRKSKLEQFFSELPNIQTQMLSLFAEGTHIVAEQEEKFRAQFPNLRDNITIYLIPSVFSFNGKSTILPTSSDPILLLGIDLIIKRHDNLNVLFSHEFFHVYHFDEVPSLVTGKTFAQPLWTEGLATYVSGVLNPGIADSQLLMDEELGTQCASEDFVKNLALSYKEILSISSDAPEAESLYADWFLMSGSTNPKRRGYCLGLHVVRKIATTHNLNEMVTWDEAKFSDEILKILQLY